MATRIMSDLSKGLVLSTVSLATLLSAHASAQCVNEWTGLGSGMSSGGVLAVRSLRVYNDGNGDALYAGGQFQSAGGAAATNLAKWNGSAWSNVGGSVNGTVFAMAEFGGSLHASGSFTTAGGAGANRIAKWNGTAWSTLGTGCNGSAVTALCVWDDGSGGGPALFVGGNFTTAGGVNCHKIAKWNGTAFSPLAGGIGNPSPAAPIINAMAVYDDGTGPALFAAGANFTSVNGDTVQANRIVKWNGTEYTALGSGLSGTANALAVFNGELYVGGAFTIAGGVDASRIAKYDGESWSGVGFGVDNEVTSLTVFDDGTGPALYVGGSFTVANFQPANGIAKWDGTTWSSLEPGMTGSTVLAVTGFGDSLIAGGNFPTAGGFPASRIASWDCNPSGACCLPSGACEVRTSYACAGGGGVYSGDGTTCETIPPCPQPPTGACCLPSGCVVIWQGGCSAQQGLYFGDGTVCGAGQCDPYVFESEPNNIKNEGNLLVLDPAKIIVGTSTATLGTGNPDSPDYFRVRTSSAPLGIYRHKMSLVGTNSPNISSWIRGTAQTPVTGAAWPCAVGVATPTEVVGQPHQVVGADRVSYWYGFGMQEEVYYQVGGVAATTAPYLATYEASPVVPTDLGTFAVGTITISTGGQGHTNDTHVRIYNADLVPIDGYSNDGATINGGAPANLTTTSFLRRDYAPGTYYMGVALINLASSVGAPCDDNVRAGQMADFPNVAFETGASTLTDISFSVTDSVGTHPFPASRPGRGEIGWFRFTVGALCGSADFDGDGDTGTDSDIEAFFACLGGNCCGTCGSPDFDGDGDTGTDADIEAFFRVLGGGAC